MKRSLRDSGACCRALALRRTPSVRGYRAFSRGTVTRITPTGAPDGTVWPTNRTDRGCRGFRLPVWSGNGRFQGALHLAARRMQGLSQIAQTIAGGRCEAVSGCGLLRAVERKHGPFPAHVSNQRPERLQEEVSTWMESRRSTLIRAFI